jgi:hypothetical protein
MNLQQATCKALGVLQKKRQTRNTLTGYRRAPYDLQTNPEQPAVASKLTLC